jgi:hypothetical protein
MGFFHGSYEMSKNKGKTQPVIAPLATVVTQEAANVTQQLYACARTLGGLTREQVELVEETHRQILMDFAKEAGRVRELAERHAFALLKRRQT